MDLNRPGLQLAGYFTHFDPRRLQVLGIVETTYLENCSRDKRISSFARLFKSGIPAIILTRGIEPFPECLEMARKHNVAVLGSNDTTSNIMSALVTFLKASLAPRTTCHGVLVECYGEGVLILGESGVGKSETAIELVKRGHRLIADDAVDIKRIDEKTLVGTAPELIRHFIELRGIGIVDVRRIFGVGSVKVSEEIDLVINIEQWNESRAYDRLGLEDLFTTMLDVKVPSLTVPVKPGRNLAVIIEVAAMNNRHKKMGFNAAQEFTQRLNDHFEKAERERDEKL